LILLQKKLNVSWVTARALLLGAALEGKIKALKTPRGWIFVSLDYLKTLNKEE